MTLRELIADKKLDLDGEIQIFDKLKGEHYEVIDYDNGLLKNRVILFIDTTPVIPSDLDRKGNP